MGETNKQVRVDNWGIFFLQRLQLFFNRTDHCDLTLQFEGNVQLKVHRLVMNACTEYFNILEQTCEVVDGNTIIMPDDLQADVILPIVNFMYTGMLEFQLSIFDKLYRTADMMNIPILTKLLDAQKKPIPPRAQSKKSQPNWNPPSKKIIPKVENDLPATLPGRKLPVWKRKSVPMVPAVAAPPQYHSEPKKSVQDPLALFDNTPKPTRFEWPEDEINSTFSLMENAFDDISYTSKPLLTQDDEFRPSTSFDEVKYTPPATNRKSKDHNQSIDMEEVKSYVKEQKIRSDMVEYDDEDDPEHYLEPALKLDKDNNKRKAANLVSPTNAKKVRFNVSEKENKETKINVTPTGKTQEMDHTKIISEVLRKYPHLVKKNKNIRLKILAKSPVKIDMPKLHQNIKISSSKVKNPAANPKASSKIPTPTTTATTKINTIEVTKNQTDGPWACPKCSTKDERLEFVLYYLYRKHMTDVHHEKFDSRMCKFCGHQSSKHNMLMYHQYTRHGIVPPPAYNFPKCNRCPYIALTETLLIKHKMNHTKFDLQCDVCKVAFNNQGSLSSHMQITGHTGKTGRHSYDCQYCIKRYQSGSNLFSHIKLMHRDEARRDGIVSIDEKDEVDEEQVEVKNEEYILPVTHEQQKEKIKILSDIKVPVSTNASTNQIVEQMPTTAAPDQGRVATASSGMENVPSAIATSLGLVDIVVLDENQQYILHNDQQLVAQQSITTEQPEYIIPEISRQHTYTQGQNINEVITSEHNVITQSILNNSDIASTDELVMVLTDHDYNDANSEILSNENSNIVVLYSHPVDGQQNQFITSQGNLMLNSQTGMLEIRNNEPPQTMDNNSQDTQIESIEMIQREINSHNIVNTPHAENTAPTASAFRESLAQNTVILQNQYASETCVIKTKESEQQSPVDTSPENGDVEKIGEKQVDSKSDDDGQEHVLILNDCLTEQNEEPMEIDEECSEKSNQNQNQNVLEETVRTHVETSVIIEPQHRVESKSMPDIGDTNDSVEEQTQTDPPHTEIVHMEEEKGTADERRDLHETNGGAGEITTEEAVPEYNKEDESAERVHEEVVLEENQIEHDHTEIQETVISEEVVENDDNVPISEQPEVIEVENSKELERDERDDQINLVVNDETVEEVQEMEVVAHEESPMVEEEGDAQAEEVHANEPEVDDNLIHEEVSQDEANIHEEVTQHVEEIVQSVEEMETEEVTENTNEASVEAQQETEEVNVPEVEESDKQAEAVSPAQIEEDQSQEEETSPPQVEESQIEETEINMQTEEVSTVEDSIQTELTDDTSKDEKFHEEIAETEEKEAAEEDASSVEENSQSQDSQTSQCSSRLEEIVQFKKTSSQETKISILNDWEDTEDSQQSDHASKKAEATVKTLIHDWDDDEDEGQVSDS